MKRFLLFIFVVAFTTLAGFAQSAGTGQITGVLKDPNQAVVANTQVVLTNVQTKAKFAANTNGQGVYTFQSLQPGAYTVAVDAKGFKPSVSPELNVTAGQSLNSDFALAIAENVESVTVSAGSVENAYRVDNVKPGSPLGTVPILNLPYSINVISRQLIDDTQSRNFKEVSKYLPLVSFQEMQGPEVLRPESRGMQGSNMQNDLKDGMGIAVTTPSALEEYEQIEVVNGLGGPLYGPANPSGMFNFVTKRPTDEQYRQIELGYEGDTVATVHTDLGGRVGPNHMFGYRTNLVLADGTGYVQDSQLRRQLAAVALDVRPFAHTVVEGNFSYYNLFQHGYPGWFSYNPTINPGTKSLFTMVPVNAPDPTRQGYGQSFAGVDLNNQISEVRVKQDFGRDWHLIVGALNQIADRDINTPVNSFVNTSKTGTAAAYYANPANYQTFLENTFQNTLAPRFQVKSDLGYLTGTVKTWGIHHDVVVGSTGYRFATYQPIVPAVTTGTPYANTPLCTASGQCTFNISDPQVVLPPPNGILSYTKTIAASGIYVNNIIHQQGFSLGDTITLTPRWLVRVAASQDWTWVDTYKANLSTGYLRVNNPTGNNSSFQGVSPTASLIFKPRPNMTIYGTFAQSIQPPDVATAATAPAITVNANEVLPAYRSKEGEIGYKLVTRRINFSTALFRIERPFATYVGGITDTAAVSAGGCGAQSGTANCQEFKIQGNQLNYGAEAMLSGRIFDSLMVTGGLSVLNPKLTDTGIAATNNKTFVGIPDYKSNILAEYRLPMLVGAFFNFDWQHVGRRAADDANTTYVPQFNTFDVGIRYSAKVLGKVATWRVMANNVSNVRYWSTLGPGSITGLGTSADLAHLGEPRLITASMRYDF